jgi:hypothetical protein
LLYFHPGRLMVQSEEMLDKPVNIKSYFERQPVLSSSTVLRFFKHQVNR